MTDPLAEFQELGDRMAWRPIETAPKDGSWVLGYENRIGMNDKYVPHEVMRWRRNRRDDAEPGAWRSSADKLCEPEFWMPLPEGPGRLAVGE